MTKNYYVQVRIKPGDYLEGRQRNFTLTENGREYLSLIKVPERAILEFPGTFEEFCKKHRLIKEIDFEVKEGPEKIPSTFNKLRSTKISKKVKGKK